MSEQSVGEQSMAAPPPTAQESPPPTPENSGGPKRSSLDNLPRYLREKLFPGENAPAFPGARTDLSPGQKEALTLALLEWCEKQNQLPPSPEEEGKGLAIVFITNPPEIEINGQKIPIVKITGVKDGKFLCIVKGQDDTIYEVETSAVINAQAQIVEQSTETGCIKESSLRTFLEKQQIQAQEGQELTEEQKKFDENLANLIKEIEGQTIISPETFARALTAVLTTHPDREQQIQLISQEIQRIDEQLSNPKLSEEEKSQLTEIKAQLEQLSALSEEETTLQIQSLAEKINNGELTPQEIDQINQFLETGNLDSLQKVLEENPNDDEETKQKKTKSRNTVKWFKENGPIIGGIAAILLFLMLFKASKSSSDYQGMMG